MKKPKALLISPYPFYPPDGGGKIRIYNDVKKLSEIFDLHVLVPMPFLRRDIEGLQFLFKKFKIFPINVNHFLDPFPRLKQIYDVFKSSFARYPMPGIYEFYNDVRVRRMIESDFSFIQLEHSWWYHTALRRRKGKLIIVEHNFEYEYWSEMGRSLLRQKKYIEGLKYIAGSLKILEQEREAIEDADLVLTVSDRETEILSRRAKNKNIYTVISGIDISYYSGFLFNSLDHHDYMGLIYVGSLNAPQTAEGAMFFVKYIWPILKEKSSRFRLYLVGRDPVPELRDLSSHDRSIVLTGFVEDVRRYIANAHIYIVPLRYGSGIRLKIMEAMAMRKPIVSTSKGIEGLKIGDCGVLIADEPEDFAKAILKLSKDAILRSKLGDINFRYAVENFSWDKIFDEKALPLYERVIQDDRS